MTAIPTSTIVNVGISVGGTFPSRKGFGILNLVTAETGVIGSAERIRLYNNIEGVSGDSWGADVIAAATSYFSQNPRPTQLKISVRFPVNVAAELRGGATVASILVDTGAIADGTFSLTIDGNQEDITGVDLSSDSSFVAIAANLQTEIRAIASGGFTLATCTHDGDRFFVKSGTTGVTSTISFFSAVSPASGTDISTLLLLTQSEATKADGINAETITDSLTAIDEIDGDWYGLSFTKEVRDLVVINTEVAVTAASAWCQPRVKAFFNTSNDLDVTDSVTTTDIASLLTAQNYGRTMTTRHLQVDQYPSASVAGRAFTTNFDNADSTITLKFKQLPGITVQNLTVNEKSVLDAKRANAFISVGGSDMYAESFMHNGSFFDELHGLDWLTDAIQTNVFGYMLTRPNKVPYTDKGVASLVQQLIKALDQAVSNGLVAPGTTIDGEFLSTGYKVTTVPVADVNQSDKDARAYNQMSFIALGAGAIHNLQIQGIFER